jgi:hypothetical protein
VYVTFNAAQAGLRGRRAARRPRPKRGPAYCATLITSDVTDTSQQTSHVSCTGLPMNAPEDALLHMEGIFAEMWKSELGLFVRTVTVTDHMLNLALNVNIFHPTILCRGYDANVWGNQERLKRISGFYQCPATSRSYAKSTSHHATRRSLL